MGKVVNKSFKQVRKNIAKKVRKLDIFLFDMRIAYDTCYFNVPGWSKTYAKEYDKLQMLCSEIVEEIDNLDEIECPDFDK